MKVVFVEYFTREKKQIKFRKYGNNKQRTKWHADIPVTKRWKRRRRRTRALPDPPSRQRRRRLPRPPETSWGREASPARFGRLRGVSRTVLRPAPHFYRGFGVPAPTDPVNSCRQAPQRSEASNGNEPTTHDATTRMRPRGKRPST